MNVIVVGCGRVGAELSYRLFQNGHKVTVIDIVESAFDLLPHDFRGKTLWGEGLSQEILRRAGIETADGLAVVTSKDTVNAVIAHIASSVYHVPNVIVRNYNTRFRSLYEIFGEQVVSPSTWGAQRIEELLYHRELRAVFSAGNGEVEVYEFTVPPAWEGQALGSLLPPGGCVPTALTRAGRAILPTPTEAIKQGDVVLVSATLEGIQDLRRRLQAVQQEGNR